MRRLRPAGEITTYRRPVVDSEIEFTRCCGCFFVLVLFRFSLLSSEISELPPSYRSEKQVSQNNSSQIADGQPVPYQELNGSLRAPFHVGILFVVGGEDDLHESQAHTALASDDRSSECIASSDGTNSGRPRLHSMSAQPGYARSKHPSVSGGMEFMA